jgi:hypothetical protein
MTLTGRPFLLGWLFLLLSPLAAAGPEPRDAAALAKKWKIPLAAAQAVQELEAERPDFRKEEQLRSWVKRMDAAIDRVASLAPESKPAWHAVMSHLEKNDRCTDDTKVRDRYLSHAWAVRDLLRSESYDCSAWRFHVPALVPVTSLLYGRVTEATEGRDQLVAVRALRDSLVRDGLPLRSPARLFAQRQYWSQLNEHGLWQSLLAEARSLPQADLELILNGQAPHEPVIVDGVQLGTLDTPRQSRKACGRSGWLHCWPPDREMKHAIGCGAGTGSGRPCPNPRAYGPLMMITVTRRREAWPGIS